MLSLMLAMAITISISINSITKVIDCFSIRTSFQSQTKHTGEGNEGKSSWPELLGAGGVVAAATIEKENRHVSAKIMLEGTFVTLEFSCSRVRVWVTTKGIVILPLARARWPQGQYL